MTKWINSLQTKLIVSFILLILIIAGTTFLYTFNETKKALLDSTREDMLQIVGMASTQLSAQEIEAMSQLKEGQDNTPEFIAFKDNLQKIRYLSPNIINFYVMNVEDKKVTFLVDDLEEDAASIGQLYEEPEDRLFEAVNKPQVSDDIYTDEWGTFLSGYAPLKGSDGKTLAILGADMSAAKVIERQNFIGNTIYFIIGIAVLIAAIIIGIFSLTIIRDIKKLNATATEISKGNTNVSVDVKRKDEIGDLAESFSRMAASLKFMMMDQNSEKGKKK